MFLINPDGLMFDEMTAGSLAKIDFDCHKLDDSPMTEPHKLRHPLGHPLVLLCH
jgi:ribulose-5-phosphate 4-epimerase/fuculose-1-phosphate aldolase